MTVSELLRELACREISLVKEGDKLRLKGKGAALPADLRQELKAHRRELLATVGGSNAGEYFGPSHTQNSLDSPSASNPVFNALLSRLQAGSKWLTSQHQAWLEGKQDAVSDERFSVALAAWGEMERSLRLVFGYEGCVFGPDRRCPEGATVVCDYCV